MKSSILKRVCVAAMFFLMLGLANRASATAPTFNGVPWQVGDVIICFGTPSPGTFGGACNVVRIVNNSPVLLDQFSDGLLGDTKGVTLNNTLHAVVTDNGTGHNGSNVVVYTIASVDPTTSPSSPIAHSVLPNTPFDGSDGTNPGNAQAVVVNKNGHIFVGNAGSGTPVPSIVELNPDGSRANTFDVPSSCIDAGGQFTSMDLSTDGNTIYFTSRGTTVQKLTLSGPTFSCATPVANFATSGSTPATPAVTLFDIAVIPPGALSQTARTIVASNGATESGNTATITTTAAHGFKVGQKVIVSGVGVSDYNGTFAIVSVTSTTFTYTAASPGLAASGGGTATLSCNGAACPSGEALLVVAKGLTGSDTDADASSEPSFLPDPGPGIAAASESGTTVTVTTSAPHGFTSGDTVQVQGVSVPGYNGTFNNISVTDATTFTYTAASGLATPASGGTVNDLTGSDDLLIDVCTGTTPTTTESSCALLVDRATGAVLARYPVSGTTTLQALTLDPLVRDCSGANETCSTSVPTVSNFWLGDNSFPNFYKLDFATGTPTQYNANLSCTGCATVNSIQGLRIFGAQGANQADLTKLFSGPLTLSNGNNPTVFAQAVSFPPGASASDLNTMNAGVYGEINAPSATFYASLVSQAGPSGNNSGATDGGVSCQPTVPSAPNSCIVWKLDVLTNSGQPLPLTSYVSTNFGAGTTDFGTHVFLDEHYDVTTFLGNFDPGGGGRISVWSLQEVPQVNFSGSSNCAFSSPVNACYKTNRTTLPFTVPFCTPTQGQFQSLQQTLLLSLVGVGTGAPKPPPTIIPLTSTNTKTPFRFDPLKDQLQFNWTVNGNKSAVPGTYLGCALDSPGTKGFSINGFCVKFTLSTTCK